MKLYKFGIGNETIVSLPVKMLDDSKKVFRQGFYYITEDKKEADYLSTVRGLMSMEPEQEEITKFVDRLKAVPTVDKELTKEDAMAFIWKDENEAYVLEELKNRGWIKEEVGADPAVIRDAKLKLKFGIVSDDELIAEVERRKLITIPVVEDWDELVSPDIQGYLDAKDKAIYLEPLHFSKIKQISDYLAIDWCGNKDKAIKLILDEQ